MCKNYVKVDNLEIATHWIALEDNRYHWGSFTPNKLYKIYILYREYKNAWEEESAKELWVDDDDNKPFNEPWMVQRGYFVKIV